MTCCYVLISFNSQLYSLFILTQPGLFVLFMGLGLPLAGLTAVAWLGRMAIMAASVRVECVGSGFWLNLFLLFVQTYL